MPTWLIWLIVAGVLAIAEVLSLDLILIMCAGAAAVTAGVAAVVPTSVSLQAAVFAFAAVGLLFVARPAAQRHMMSAPHTATGIEALVGKKAVVLRTVDAHSGLVKLHGEEWSARSYDPHQVLDVGRVVDVMEIKGATALVWGDP